MICLRQKMFLRIYGRRNKFRYVIKKGIQGKSNIQRDLPACVVRKFNGYEILKIRLKVIEKPNHEPIDTIYEPVNDERHIQCFFTDDLHLVYRSYHSKKKRKLQGYSLILLQGNVTIVTSILHGTRVGFMIE